MAGNRIDINLSVQDQSRTLQTRTNDAKKLNEQLERSQNLMRSTTGTRTGAGAARQAGFGGEVNAYNIARGAGERAGGSARDFADQARGLGGLVRLYAEYAANLFAVSAAFTALRNAMDTQIMIKGMEQLSASTGDSLASMSTSFLKATDGMISFREAAEAVTKATTSGLGQEQVLQIATVAKGASQALGVNMNDAVSRLTRGITKLEPELLDELGIFTKLDKAVSDYARTVGKSESQLTDFERRQAFANAVLKEGRDKFAEIAQEGNPYDKLLATLKDTGTKILTIINSIVGPIAKIFADNQVLIGGAIAVIASKLITKAVPALQNYNEWLRETAKESARIASGMSDDAWHGQYTRLADKAGMSASQKRVMDLANENLSLEKQIDDAKKKQVGTIVEIIKRDNEVIRMQSTILKNQREISKERQKQNDIAQATEERMKNEPTLLKDTWGFMKAKIAEMENTRARSLDIRSQVTDVAQEQGPIAALEKLSELLNSASTSMGFFARAGTRVAAVISIIGVTIRTALSFLSPFLKIIGLVIAAYEFLAPYIHKNTKEIEAFNTKVDQLNDTVKTATDVNQKYKMSLSTEALLAYANSFDSVSKAMRATTDSFNEAAAAANPFDKMLESIKNLIPGMDSLQEKAAKAVGTAVQAQLTTLGDRPEAKKYREDISSILGVDPKKPLDAKVVTNALDSIFVSSEKYAEMQGKITKVTEEANKKFQEQTLYLKGLKEESRNAEKSASEFMNSLKDTSKITTFQENNLKYVQQLNKALESSDFRTQAAALDSLKGANFGALFGEAAVEVARLSDEFERLQEPLDAASKELTKVNTRIEELKDKGFLWFSEQLELEGKLKLKEELEKTVKGGQKVIAELTQAVGIAISKSVAEQAAATIQKFKLEFQKLGVEQAKFIASKNPVKTVEGIAYQAKLDLQLISIEEQLVNANYDLAKSIDDLNYTIQGERDARRLTELQTRATDFLANKPGSQQLTDTEKTEISKLLDRTNPELFNRARQLVAGDAKSLGLTQKEFEAEIAKYLQMFPNLASAFNRNLTRSLKVKGSEYKKEQTLISKEIDTINLQAQQAIQAIDDEIQSLNTALSNIGADTPERIQIQMDYALTIYEQETAKINLATKAKLDALDVLAKSSKPPEDLAASRARAQYEDAVAKKKLDQTTQETKLQNAAQKTYLEEKRKLDIIISIAEAQKGLIIGEGLLAEQRRQGLDRLIEQTRMEEELLSLNKNLVLSEAKLAAFRLANANSEGLTPAQNVQLQGLLAAVEADKEAIAGKKLINGLIIQGNEAQRKQNILVLEQAVNMAKLEASLAREANQYNTITTAREHIISLNEQDLDIQQRLGLINDRNAQLAKADIARQKVQLDYDRESFRLLQEKSKLEQTLRDLAAKNPLTQPRQTMIDGGEIVTQEAQLLPEQIKALSDLKTVMEAIDALRIKSVNSIQLINRELDITPRMEKYSTAFKSMFESMADAIVEFAKTGKFNFKDLINNFIADIARYELRLQAHEAYATSRPYLQKFLSNLFGFGGYSSDTFSASNTAVPGFGYTLAMGGAFNRGIQAYANGGMFTNSIVNQPTFFRAAQGLGVMGEAGPEAIMPLKRDSQGNLGVRTNQGNVEVVVNNYTQARAETRETTDSRGNRRIEVIVADLVAGEISRPNSNIQQSFVNSFGTKPMVARR